MSAHAGPAVPELVSVVICTHNRAQMLSEVLGMLLPALQEYGQPAEVLVVNNASTDDTEAAVKRFGEQHPEVPLRLYTEPRLGVAHARNAGLRQCRGELVCFVEDDVIVPPEWLRELIGAYGRCREEARVGAVGGQIKLAWPDCPKPVWFDDRCVNALGRYYFGDADRVLPTGTELYTGNCLLTREAISRVGDFNVSLGRVGRSLLGGEDTDYGFRLWGSGFVMAYSAAGYVSHRVPPERLTVGWHARRAFWGGVTARFMGHRLQAHPLFNLLEAMRLCISTLLALVTFNPRRAVFRCMRILECVGAAYGWYLQRKRRAVSAELPGD